MARWLQLQENRTMMNILKAPFKLLAIVFGSLSWVAPPWIKSATNHKGALLGLLLTLTSAALGFYYYDGLPKPLTVKPLLSEIQLTPNYDDADPSNLYIEFNYNLTNMKQGEVRPSGQPSVARIDLVDKTIEDGVRLFPAKQGQWIWITDRKIQFIPESDWPAGTQYRVEFNANIFSPDTLLSDETTTFFTPDLTATFLQSEFYQDPQDSSIRKVVATVEFSHPIEKESFEKKLSMSMRESGAEISDSAQQYKTQVTYSKNRREAYVHSDPIKLPQKTNFMSIDIAPGIKSLLGGEGLVKAVQAKVEIPNVFSFLKAQSSSQIVKNNKGEPEQLVMLEFTDEIAQDELKSKLALYLLPGRDEKNGRSSWQGPRQVSKNVLANSQPIEYKIIENPRSASKQYHLVIEQIENRQLYLKIDGGLTSINQFVHASEYDSVLRVPIYPKEINIIGDGSVLSYSGNHKISVMTRGLTALKYTIGQVRDGQLHHLISQTDGDISNPEFSNWNFEKTNISDMKSSIVRLRQQDSKSANYSSFDLSRFVNQAERQYGLFFVEVQAYDTKRKRVIYGTSDRRLILVTDLGVIVKNNADSTHQVFVQSVTNGLPVANAKVELLAKNGSVVYSGRTDRSGKFSVPATNKMAGSKRPILYTVKSGSDLSFIPFDRYSRQINLSRFDIGGIHASEFTRNSLNAYLFSDRGIYRPGEEVNLGIVVKTSNFNNVENIPLELIIRGPRYQEVKVSKFNLAKNGLADFQMPTMATSDTGRYTASLHLIRSDKRRGYEIGQTEFSVEEFQPDSMKIESKLELVQDMGWNNQETMTAKVTLNNLFGTPAQNRLVTGRLIIQPHNFQFKQYSDYRFTDPYFDPQVKPLRLNTELPEQKTDADGIAKFKLDLDRFNQGTYRLIFSTHGFDQAGGRSVSASNTALISPLNTLIGFKADGKLDYINKDSQRSIEFIAIDQQLKKISAQGLTLRLKEIQNISTLVKQYDETYQYQTIKKEKELSSELLVLPESGYVYSIDSQMPGDYALEIIDQQNRRLARVHFSIVGYANLSGKIDKSAELQLKLNKQDYLPGELIEMNIKAPYEGAGLITIETDRVIHHKWFKSSEESIIESIKLPADIEGTGYINVSFMRDIASKEIFTSPLSYAVQPFSIDKNRRNIDINLSHQSIARPGKTMEINFSTSKPAKIIVFAVDEGILQVANHNTPDPLSHYSKKRALGVQTFQILDLILPDFDIVKNISSAGGGSAARNAALAKNINPFSRKTDKPAVFWSGVYDANSDVNSVSFDIPNTFAGELRVMAVAVAEDAVGATQSSAIVRGPFVISPNLLTHAAPGDEFLVTVGVANIIEGSGKQAPVELTAVASEHLEILGSKSVKLNIDEGSEDKHTFKVRAKTKLGSAELTFKAKSKNEELSRSASMSIRPATTYYTSVETGFSKKGLVELPIKRHLHDDLAKQSVSASKSPLVVVDGLHSYLENYPHGCTEQVVSKVFPLVGLMSHPAYSPHLKDVKAHFSHLIDKLRERQTSDGGFVFWPGQSYSAVYPSIYVMHFLLEAREQGFPVPTDMLRRGKSYLEDQVSQQTRTLSEARDRANGIYLLTRMGVVTTNYLVDLEEHLIKQHALTWQKDILATYMAATYKQLQKDQEAQRLLSQYKLAGSYNELTDFRTKLALDAQYIYLISKHFEAQAKAIDVAKIHALTDQILRGEYNTISAAYSILALGAYSQLALSNDIVENIRFKSNDGNQDKNLVMNAKPFPTVDYFEPLVKLIIESDSALYYVNQQSGFNQALPATEIKDGLEVYRSFVNAAGEEVSEIEQGTEVTVKLKIRSLKNQLITNVAVVDLLPGGFEIIRESVARTAYNWQADYVDVREDRVVYYGSFDQSVKELTYRVKVTAAGDFVVPPSYADSMYDRSIRGMSKASRFVVTKKK